MIIKDFHELTEKKYVALFKRTYMIPRNQMEDRLSKVKWIFMFNERVTLKMLKEHLTHHTVLNLVLRGRVKVRKGNFMYMVEPDGYDGHGC